MKRLYPNIVKQQINSLMSPDVDKIYIKPNLESIDKVLIS